MKRSLPVLALLVLASFSTSSLGAEPDNETTVKFAVENMTCATCPISVRKAMERVDGVKEVKVDFESNAATVTFDSSMATASDIGNASTDVGFPASVMDDQ
jgi:mercuric ion binding protein